MSSIDIGDIEEQENQVSIPRQQQQQQQPRNNNRCNRPCLANVFIWLMILTAYVVISVWNNIISYKDGTLYSPSSDSEHNRTLTLMLNTQFGFSSLCLTFLTLSICLSCGDTHPTSLREFYTLIVIGLFVMTFFRIFDRIC
jgi:hypothetical protein